MTRILIMGAAGRDFHNFNVVYRHDPAVQVVAFTAAQIPNIANRIYPPELAGPQYAAGIPIYPESELERLIRELAVDRVVFAYSDVSLMDVMHAASRVLAAGADFSLLGPRRTELRAACPVVAVCAVRTGAGKSPTSRYVCRALTQLGYRVVAVRHPMPYGDLVQQAVQRFESLEDLERANCTIEEREEYEPLLEAGITVHAGVDYARILRAAEAEADVIVWDGGNNDMPFFVPDLHIVIADACRPGHERAYHPGEANARAADILVISKTDAAPPEDVRALRASLQELNPNAAVVETAMPVRIANPQAIRGKRVLVVEDGPTVTHGGLRGGAGARAAREHGALELVDPRPWSVGSIRDIYRAHPTVGPILPATGYGKEMLAEMEQTINRAPADIVLAGTPIDLGRLLRVNKPVVRVHYDLADRGMPTLEQLLKAKFPRRID